MPKIIQLDSHIANLIAAGEVVERPASVVKELLENAVDAGASKVTVEIRNGGMTFMRVTDNGCGMAREDAKTAFLRHATSKLRTAEDLSMIGTMGFRGEALAAIASVSRIELLTKTAGAVSGTSLMLEAGKIREDSEAGCPEGTTILIRDLFFNTPARMKFMKSDTVEGSRVASAVQMQAMAHPEVAIQFIRDGKQILSTPGNGALQSAIYCIYGRDCAKMVKVDSHWDKYALTGYISKPTDSRPSRAMQTFFVNDRPVKSRLLTAALEEAYRNQIMVGKFPSCVLHLTVPAGAVDVNVHPAKTEVKFLNEKAVFDCLHYGVLGTLNKTPDRPSVQFTRKPEPEEEAPGQPAAFSAPAKQAAAPQKNPDFYRTMNAQEYKAFTGAVSSPAVPQPAAAAATAKKVQEENASLLRQNVLIPQKDSDVLPISLPSMEPVPETPQELKPVRVEAEDWDAPDDQNTSENAQTASKEALAEKHAAMKNAAYQEFNSRFLDQEQKAPETSEKSQKELLAEKHAAMKNAAYKEFNSRFLDSEQTAIPMPEVEPWRLVGELYRTYIIVEQGDEAFLIDKHAAHERINFEKLKANQEKICGQELLTPLTVRLSSDECGELLSNRDMLEELGFVIEEFGENTILVRQIPMDLSQDQAGETLESLAADLLHGRREHADTVRDNLLHTVACKAAIKAGWVTDVRELHALVKQVMEREDLKYCPHGRPICISLSKHLLEKQFKRIV